MNREEYNYRLKQINKQHDREVEEADEKKTKSMSELAEDFAKSNDIVSIGDIVKDAIVTIKVDKKEVVQSTYHLPYMRYTGYVVNMVDGKPQLMPSRRSVMQIGLRAINGKRAAYLV